MVWIPGGTFLMSDKHYQEEAPADEVTVDGFWMDKHTVTNEEFRRFVEATRYVTFAERPPNTVGLQSRFESCSLRSDRIAAKAKMNEEHKLLYRQIVFTTA
jgi:formylglycine-generating enzyme required for sulfatase activity